MTIKYQPKKLLKKLASKTDVENLVTDNLKINRAVLDSVTRSGVLSKKKLEYVALNVLKKYREKSDAFQNEGLTKGDANDEVLANKKLLVQRVQNATVQEITKTVKENYRGEFYVWLPSTAANPDPAHMKKYGKKFQIGRGEAPGDRYGCQCGMEILVNETRLNLE